MIQWNRFNKTGRKHRALHALHPVASTKAKCTYTNQAIQQQKNHQT